MRKIWEEADTSIQNLVQPYWNNRCVKLPYAKKEKKAEFTIGGGKMAFLREERDGEE